MHIPSIWHGRSFRLKHIFVFMRSTASVVATQHNITEHHRPNDYCSNAPLLVLLKSIQDLRESLHKTESALSSVAVSFGAREECVQRWKDATASGATEAPEQAGGDNPLAVSLRRAP